jgi:magnesium-transporting ATPase (P-type)
MGAVGISIIGPFIGVENPITVIQMLWINIIMDTLSGLAFSGEAARPRFMQEAPKSRQEKIMNKYMWNQVITISAALTVIYIAFLKVPAIANYFNKQDGYLMTAFFALFMFTAIATSFTARTARVKIWDGLSMNKTFGIIMSLVFVAQTVMIYVGGSVFRVVPLALVDLVIILALSSLIVLVDTIRKEYLKSKGPIIGT